MNKKQLIAIILSLFLSVGASGQLNIDTVIIRYLQTVKGIPKPELIITKQNSRIIHSTNYFVLQLENIKSLDKEFKTFLFGSTTSHEKKYFLIQVLSNKHVVNKVIDNPSFEDGVKEVFLFLKEFNVSDETKSFIIRQLTFAYN